MVQFNLIIVISIIKSMSIQERDNENISKYLCVRTIQLEVFLQRYHSKRE